MCVCRYVYKHYLHSAEWFIKADDDTYINVDNLRAYVNLCSWSCSFLPQGVRKPTIAGLARFCLGTYVNLL